MANTRPFLPPALGGRRLDSLTGLRALAAFAVFLVHFQARLDGAPAATTALLFGAGAMGVTFFFALSGFVLTWSVKEGDSARSFWRRRFARIYPAYFVACLGGVAFAVLQHDHGIVGAPLVTQFLLVQAWVPDPRYFFAFNGVGWSLSCEAFFYALFPLLILALRPLSTAGRRAVQIVALMVLVGAATTNAVVPNMVTEWLMGQAPFTTVFTFILGVTVALDVAAGTWRRLDLRLMLALLAVVYLAGGIAPNSYSNGALTIVPVLGVLAAAAWRDITGTGSAFSRPWVVWCGEISFAFYLIHQLVVRAFSRVVATTASWGVAAALFVAVLGVAVLAAWALHRLVERPLERVLRGPSRIASPVTLEA